MKKIFLTVALLLMLCLTGCNYDMIDTTFTYDKAIIDLNNGNIVEVDVKQWKDYDGEQIQIVSKDGTIYLTSSFNCTLIKNAK